MIGDRPDPWFRRCRAGRDREAQPGCRSGDWKIAHPLSASPGRPFMARFDSPAVARHRETVFALDLARLRAMGRNKPGTKAGQVRQAWPEIRELLAAGHTLKDICVWLNEVGVEIGYARLSDYVNQLRRAQPDPRQSSSSMPATPIRAARATDSIRPGGAPATNDPRENLRRSEAKRPGVDYRLELADPNKLI